MAAVWLTVRINVVPVTPGREISASEATESAREAVFNALYAARESGFDHERVDELSLTVNNVEVAEFDLTV
jgi:hypothetical protein